MLLHRLNLSTFSFLGIIALVSDGAQGARNTSSCPGYELTSRSDSETGFVAALKLNGPPCDAFGNDIPNLTIQVTYESTSRLHVNIFDSNHKQFVVPESVVSRPPAPTQSFVNGSDLVFNFESSPFTFWVTRRSDPQSLPLFDTRLNSLPATPIPPVIANDNSTALDNFNLVFEDQYLQLTSALPNDANIYGLGEFYSESGFRRRISENGGSIQTFWDRDAADPIDANMYGSHPFYMEHRFNEARNDSQSHGVFLMSSSGGDVLMLTPRDTLHSLVQYRMIGGTLDLYFFSGPHPQAVVEQYGELIGFPTWQPIWGFGFQLCRFGYHDLNETREQVTNMREAGIPLEVMWNDIDLYLAFRDFTTDPERFPAEAVRAFIHELAANHQKYIPIVDAAIAKTVNSTDLYNPYSSGNERGVFIKNPDGSEYIGQVWPGFTVFPDWFGNSTQSWWTEALRNWSESGVEYSGIWLDMNEPSSFCEGSCGTGQLLSKLQVPPVVLPGTPGNLVTDYPECYDPDKFGPSGNITVNGTLTCQPSASLSKRAVPDPAQTQIDVNSVPYAIHNGNGRLSVGTVATNATHANGIVDINVHNLFGLTEEKATHLALQQLKPGTRPFLIARSTFPSSGKWTGHWLGDNFSKWQYLYLNIQGVLQFQLFQIPFVGADTCGFNGNTDEELCNRWMQLSAFMPFYRNHNTKGAISQEPYRWESVTNASRIAIAARYSLLPYWYTLFANSSIRGTPPVRALFFEFPNEPELFGLDTQYMVGRDILITPVLSPNVTSVDGIFPGRGQVVWRDFFTHQVVQPSSNGNTTLDAPLGHINVHIRDGSAILMHANPGYTTEETRQGPFDLLVSLSLNRQAYGSYYLDDGLSFPPGPNTTLTILASNNQLVINPEGQFKIGQPLQGITILGIGERPSMVAVHNDSITSWVYDESLGELKISNMTLDLNTAQAVMWG
ncbi:hypothetical protein E1B28_006078 [Marasmius oreades]|uniref:alpha-glucosidase n=1 Tax=Marasmius oreades TaxID=181124 RepID=A0A9P7UV83_9AGAR|nr:uncharacterized protein E1B28_006078 [Marasmius oreades]KAG7095313.1 hypothetical protein E1B28_006078 [Marasmius oreades]